MEAPAMDQQKKFFWKIRRRKEASHYAGHTGQGSGMGLFFYRQTDLLYKKEKDIGTARETMTTGEIV